MDFLKAEIERKKRQIQEKGVMAGPNKKYFKRGDLADKQREEYLAKHAPNLEDVKQLQETKVGSKEKCKEPNIILNNSANCSPKKWMAYSPYPKSLILQRS